MSTPTTVPVAFICNLQIPDDSPDSLGGIAEHLTALLEDEGFIVTSVTPWDRESLSTTTGLDINANIPKL